MFFRVLLFALLIPILGACNSAHCTEGCDASQQLTLDTNQPRPYKFNFANSNSDKKFSLGEDIGFGLKYSHSLQKNFQRWGVVISEDIVRLGKKAIKFETREGFCGFDRNGKWSDCKNGRNRHEFSSRFKDGNSVFPLNKDFWHALSVYVPDDPKFEIPVETGIFQFHGKPNVAWKFHFSDVRGFYLTNYIDPWKGKTLVKPKDFENRWNDIVIQVKHSTTPAGVMRVWINGKLKYDYNGITTRHQGKPYFKFGIYNTAKPVGNPNYNHGANFNNIWVYFDEIRFANSCQKLKLGDLGYDCGQLASHKLPQ